MEPSFLLEGVAHPDRFLPPKHEYHCTQMAMRQLERLNGGYRPVYAQKILFYRKQASLRASIRLSTT